MATEVPCLPPRSPISSGRFMPDRPDQAPVMAPASTTAHQADVRRRRREGIIILATALAVVTFALVETRLPQFAGRGSLGTDAVLVLLINLNLIDRKSTRLN